MRDESGWCDGHEHAWVTKGQFADTNSKFEVTNGIMADLFFKDVKVYHDHHKQKIDLRAKKNYNEIYQTF